MAFFDDEKYTISFEVDGLRKANFDLALKKLGKTKEELFDAFLAMLITKALRGEAEEPVAPKTPEDSNRLPKETICSRIRRWADRKYSYPHMMLAAYFEAERTCPEGMVLMLKVQGHFNALAGFPDDDDAKFMSIFRQMCSASTRAYGNVFVYDRRDRTIHLNEEYQDIILGLKDKFLPPEPDYR